MSKTKEKKPFKPCKKCKDPKKCAVSGCKLKKPGSRGIYGY